MSSMHATRPVSTASARRSRRPPTPSPHGLQGKGKLPNLTDNQITDMVVSFEVADERMTTVRYTADYTYHFRKAGLDVVLQKVLRKSAGVAASRPIPSLRRTPPARPAAASRRWSTLPPSRCYCQTSEASSPLVLWDDPNPWRDAWTGIAHRQRLRPAAAAARRRHRPRRDRCRQGERRRQRTRLLRSPRNTAPTTCSSRFAAQRGPARKTGRARHRGQTLSRRAARRRARAVDRRQPGRAGRAISSAAPPRQDRRGAIDRQLAGRQAAQRRRSRAR